MLKKILKGPGDRGSRIKNNKKEKPRQAVG